MGRILEEFWGKGGALMFSKKFKPGIRDFSKLFGSDASLSPYTPGERPSKVRALAVT